MAGLFNPIAACDASYKRKERKESVSRVHFRSEGRGAETESKSGQERACQERHRELHPDGER